MARKTSEEIVIDIFKNRLVPKARILKQEEKDTLLEKYNISIIQLPKIRVQDPVSKKLGAKPGDIIEFERKISTAGLSKYYRTVAGSGA